jgi:hypothetical protein
VEIDLDLTALCPWERTRRALAATSSAFGVREFAYPQPELPLLPGYTAEAWSAFLKASGLVARYPGLAWDEASAGQVGTERSVYSVFHSHYWTTDWLIEDEPTPGLGEFVRCVEDLGGTVVFLSGRWRTNQIPASRTALQRAGIANPTLLIGNPRHEENLCPGEKAWSDAEVKALCQGDIVRRYGIPVAVFDDRRANRDAVIAANADILTVAGLPSVLGVGVAIPGFSYDPETEQVPYRVATFESFTAGGADARREPYVAARYPDPPNDSVYRGLIAGLGRNGRGYILPRLAFVDAPNPVLPSEFPRPFAALAKAAPGSLTEEAFMAAAEETIPDVVCRQLDEALNQAEQEAKLRLAAPFPDKAEDRASLRHSLACSWLHSRDIEVVMAAVGYPLHATGIHDMEEFVPAEDVIEAIVQSLGQGNRYSDWFLRWVQRLDQRGTVNVGFLNPSLTVGTWMWRSDTDMPQDAMDAHRISSHHEGDGAGRYDPVEATINNLLHAREGSYGVQKTPVTSWHHFEKHARTVAGASALAKSTWGGHFLLDAIPILRSLEERGYIMPWGVVASTVPPAN